MTKLIINVLILLTFLGCKQTPSIDAGIHNHITTDTEWSESDFKTPPNSAKVQTWYHWLNGHVTKGGKGLEVDKMSADAVDIHWEESVMKMLMAGEEGDNSSLTSVTIDSYEAGQQNWTKGFEKEFTKMSGYDIRQYLPAIAGRVVESTEVTEKFLWDFRKTVNDLIVTNYYKRFQELAHENGVWELI